MINFYYSLTQYSLIVNFVLKIEKYLFGIDIIHTFVHIKIKSNKVMKARNYIPQISVYYSEKNYNDYNNAIQQAIQQAIKHFKEFYSRFDKRLLTTKKKVNVNIKGHILNVNIDFNKVHYSQCYEIVNYNEINGLQINY